MTYRPLQTADRTLRFRFFILRVTAPRTGTTKGITGAVWENTRDKNTPIHESTEYK